MKLKTLTGALILSMSALITFPVYADEASKNAATYLMDSLGMDKAMNDSVSRMLDVQIKQRPEMRLINTYLKPISQNT